MKAATVEQAVQLLESGSGPVEISLSLSRKLAAQRPEFFDGWARAQRVAAFGGGPYAPDVYERYELRILPDPDPISRAEQKARSKFGRKLAEATEREELARAAYEVAEAAYLDLFGRSIAIGESWGVSALGRLIQSPQDLTVTEAERQSLKAEVANAQEVRNEAADALHKARVKLNRIEASIDTAARLVRLAN